MRRVPVSAGVAARIATQVVLAATQVVGAVVRADVRMLGEFRAATAAAATATQASPHRPVGLGWQAFADSATLAMAEQTG